MVVRAMAPLVFVGVYVARYVYGENVPGVVGYFLENQILCLALLWFLTNAIANGLTTTGAFELYVDGKLYYSKLETGDVPSVEGMVNIVMAKARGVREGGGRRPFRRSQLMPEAEVL